MPATATRTDQGTAAQMPNKYSKISLAEYWESYTMPIPESGCLIWLGSTDRAGRYGRIRKGEIDCSAHRFAYEQAHGTIPAGLMICHHCDVTLCVNHAHLFAGTQKDNLHDASMKGRMPGNKKGSGAAAYIRRSALVRGRKRPAQALVMASENRRRAAIRRGLPWPPLQSFSPK